MRTCWILCDQGKVGTFNQCLGLADRLGLHKTIFFLTPRFPWSILPPRYWFRPLSGIQQKLPLHAPPDVVISGGRVSAAPAAFLKQKWRQKVKSVHLMNPYLSLSQYDVVVAPEHDHLKGPNVISTCGALHKITKSDLHSSGWYWDKRVEKTPRPLCVYLVGGTGKKSRVSLNHFRAQYQPVLKAVQKLNGTCLFVVSRRTPKEWIEEIENIPQTNVYVEKGQNEGGYLSALALSDFLLVTSDSVSMVTEACFTGKPVYILSWPHHRLKKFDVFYQTLAERGNIKFFDGSLVSWCPDPLDEMARVVSKIEGRLKNPS